MTRLSLDDFEWVERGFDHYVLTHKTYDVGVAQIMNFNGWRVHVRYATSPSEVLIENALDLDAAQAIAALYANKHMEDYQDVIDRNKRRGTLRKRAPEYRPEKVPKGIFKVG